MNAKNSNIGNVFLLLIAAASVGTRTFMAALLAVGVVLLYGGMLALVRRRNADGASASPLVCRVGAALAAPGCFILIAAWSSTVGLSFLAGLATWTLIVAASVSWTRTAAWRERLRDTVVRPRLGLSAC